MTDDNVITNKEDIDDFFAHFGVKGMKWGVSRSDASLARANNRALNAASKARDKKAHSTGVQKARNRTENGKAKERYDKAKAEYVQNKTKMGSREAKKILNKAKSKIYADIDKASEYKDGKEAAQAVALTVGTTLAVYAVTIGVGMLKNR